MYSVLSLLITIDKDKDQDTVNNMKVGVPSNVQLVVTCDTNSDTSRTATPRGITTESIITANVMTVISASSQVTFKIEYHLCQSICRYYVTL